jgi:putative glycosyltransferase
MAKQNAAAHSSRGDGIGCMVKSEPGLATGATYAVIACAAEAASPLRMSLSIVSTLYKSEPYLDEFVSRCVAAAEALGEPFKLILIDDGSPDNSLSIAKERALRDERIAVIELSRNFGHHRALLAGLEYAAGDRVFLIDSDLEEPPEVLGEFARVMAETGADVVFGVHDQTAGSLARTVTSAMFWRVFRQLSGTSAPLDICIVRLMSQRYVAALLSLPETNIFLGGLFHWVGYKQIGIPVARTLRRRVSTYSFFDRTRMAVSSIVSFSTAPLRAMFYFGALVAGVSFLIALFFLVNQLLSPSAVPMGYTSLIISIWFLSGLIIACLGVVGIYVAYIYREVKGRPRVVVRDVHGLDKP